MTDAKKLKDRIKAAHLNQDVRELDACMKLVQDELLKAFSVESRDRIEELSSLIAYLTLGSSSFPQGLFEFLMDLFTRPRFLESAAAFHVLSDLQSERASLTESQRDRLLEVVEATWHEYKHFMSNFVISELLGQFYCNDRGLAVVRRLKLSSRGHAREMLPHALEHLVTDSQDVKTSNAAMVELLDMQADPNEAVRNEVQQSLGRVAARARNDIYS